MTPPEQWNYAGLRYELIAKITQAFVVPIWIWRGFNTRREMVEAELGYRVPDFAWKAMERQRRTFGSGNGRVMRD